MNVWLLSISAVSLSGFVGCKNRSFPLAPTIEKCDREINARGREIVNLERKLETQKTLESELRSVLELGSLFGGKSTVDEIVSAIRKERMDIEAALKPASKSGDLVSQVKSVMADRTMCDDELEPFFSPSQKEPSLRKTILQNIERSLGVTGLSYVPIQGLVNTRRTELVAAVMLLGITGMRPDISGDILEISNKISEIGDLGQIKENLKPVSKTVESAISDLKSGLMGLCSETDMSLMVTELEEARTKLTSSKKIKQATIDIELQLRDVLQKIKSPSSSIPSDIAGLVSALAAVSTEVHNEMNAVLAGTGPTLFERAKALNAEVLSSRIGATPAQKLLGELVTKMAVWTAAGDADARLDELLEAAKAIGANSGTKTVKDALSHLHSLLGPTDLFPSIFAAAGLDKKVRTELGPIEGTIPTKTASEIIDGIKTMLEKVGDLVTVTGYLGNPDPGNPTIEHVIARILKDLGGGSTNLPARIGELAQQSGELVQALGGTKSIILMSNWGYLQSEIKKIGNVGEIGKHFSTSLSETNTIEKQLKDETAILHSALSALRSSGAKVPPSSLKGEVDYVRSISSKIGDVNKIESVLTGFLASHSIEQKIHSIAGKLSAFDGHDLSTKVASALSLKNSVGDFQRIRDAFGQTFDDRNTLDKAVEGLKIRVGTICGETSFKDSLSRLDSTSLSIGGANIHQGVDDLNTILGETKPGVGTLKDRVIGVKDRLNALAGKTGLTVAQALSEIENNPPQREARMLKTLKAVAQFSNHAHTEMLNDVVDHLPPEIFERVENFEFMKISEPAMTPHGSECPSISQYRKWTSGELDGVVFNKFELHRSGVNSNERLRTIVLIAVSSDASWSSPKWMVTGIETAGPIVWGNEESINDARSVHDVIGSFIQQLRQRIVGLLIQRNKFSVLTPPKGTHSVSQSGKVSQTIGKDYCLRLQIA